MMDRPYDIDEQAGRVPGDEPADFQSNDDPTGDGPSTMDRSDRCSVCGARNFGPSLSGTGCNFCNGVEAGHIPTAEVLEQNLVQLTSARRSPWIPRPIDNTALDSYMSCPRKYYYAMVLNRRGRGSEKPALAYGTTWHAIMEEHYRTGGDETAVARAAIASWKPHANPEDHRTLERCLSEYGKFLGVYGTHDQEAKNFGKTVGFPDSPIVEIPAEIWWPGALHPYTGKIDRIFELHGLYYVEDHKTTSAMGPTYFKQFDPSNQMMGYAWIAQKLTGLPIAGVRINAHAVLKTQSKFERQIIMVSPDRLEEWAENLNEWVVRLENSHRTLKHALVPTPELSAFPHNFNACAGKYGQCTYTDVCTYPAALRGQILEQEFEESPWNPLNPDGDSDAS